MSNYSSRSSLNFQLNNAYLERYHTNFNVRYFRIIAISLIEDIFDNLGYNFGSWTRKCQTHSSEHRIRLWIFEVDGIMSYNWLCHIIMSYNYVSNFIIQLRKCHFYSKFRNTSSILRIQCKLFIPKFMSAIKFHSQSKFWK